MASRVFARWLKECTPSTNWKKLVRKTRFNNEIVEVGSKVGLHGDWEIGISLQRIGNRIEVTTRTINDVTEDINSYATFQLETKVNKKNKSKSQWKFVKGMINNFIHLYPDDEEGSYHKQLFTELLSKPQYKEWDIIE